MPETLGDTLRALRRERRINSQHELARLADVSQSTVRLIEASDQSDSKPHTLRKLARGLATDLDGAVDTVAWETIYARLMRAAGYWPQPMPAEDDQDMSREEWLEQTARRLGRTDLAVAMSTVAFDYDRIPRTHQRLIEAALLALNENGPEENRSRKRR